MNLRLPAADRRRQLLDVAVEVFSRRGFHATSMNDVAKAAGVTKPVLYTHFGSKRGLYRALLDDVGARLRQDIEAAVATEPGPRAQVEAGFRAYFRFVAEHRSAFALLFGGGARRDTEFAEAVRAVEVALAEVIAARIDAPIEPAQRLLFAHGIVGLAEATSRHWVNDGLARDPDQLAADVAGLAWAGLRGVGGG